MENNNKISMRTPFVLATVIGILFAIAVLITANVAGGTWLDFAMSLLFGEYIATIILQVYGYFFPDTEEELYTTD